MQDVLLSFCAYNYTHVRLVILMSTIGLFMLRQLRTSMHNCFTNLTCQLKGGGKFGINILLTPPPQQSAL